MMTRGYAAPEVEQTYARARDLCQQIGQSAQLFPVLHGLWRLYVNRAELHTARALGEQLVMLAQNSQDPALLLQAYRALGPTVMYGGELALARAHLEQGIALYDRQQHRIHTLLYGQDPGVVCHIYAALALWLLGYPEQAQQRVDEVQSLVQELEHPFSLAYVLSHTAIIHQLRREVPAPHMRTETIIALSREKGFSFWLTWGTMLRGWAVAQLGQREEGTAAISEGLAAYQATGAGLLRPMFLGLLADVYGLGGEATEGLRVLADASAVMDTTGERWWEPELHRLRGELLLGSAGENQVDAEACFHQALQVAQRQQAKALELRTAMSLSRLWQRQDKRAEARQLLAETYCWFMEGFDTPDLQEAKALLEAWS
jgi:predicted ATPase